jgi:hypothetical protein
VQAGGLPVWVGKPADRASDVARVRVTVQDANDQAPLAHPTLLLDVARADGGTQPGWTSLSMDYSGFATAIGADWAGRLRLVQLPRCALSTPQSAACMPIPLVSHNNVAAQQLSGDVPLGGGDGTLVAATAGASDSAGTFTASSLQASATWSAGGNSGAFTWSYPMRTPPSLGGPAPAVALAYSSSAVDGRNQATNNQPSWVGEGFDWWPGYIERSYKTCADDMGGGANNSTETGDECWGTDNATLSLSGAGGELIKDDATGAWHPKYDDNTLVQRLTDTVNADNNHEYWKLTTADGTQYYFGLNRLPGYTGTAPADKTTSSVWTVPVAGNNTGEPCHAAAFIDSFCNQAWRWNLDYVVDTHGNTMSLYYGTETNKYARNNTTSDAATYTRGGWLDHIAYGTDNRSGTDTANTATLAPMRVIFGTADRCLSDCATHDGAHWPDTPWDQECTGAPCLNGAPTFWTTKRLATITTQVLAGASYKDVDGWTLTHTFPDPGDGTRAGMWLDSIVHTGEATGPAIIDGPVSLPETNFDWTQLPNRVDTDDDSKYPMNWMRLSTIWTDTGAQIDIRYSGPECVPGTTMPASPQTNMLRCYPVLEENPDHSITTDYFHKYVVTNVTEADLTGGGPNVVTNYEYVGGVAWRHTDDNGLTKDNLRTWSDYRGYTQVNTRVGEPANGPSLTEDVYFRGMNGDLDGAGGTRTVNLPAIDLNNDGDTNDEADAGQVADQDAFAGMLRQSTTFNGTEAAPISTTVNQPRQSDPTASRDTGSTTVHARHTATEKTWNALSLTAGGRRVSEVDVQFDDYFMPTSIDDQGDVAASGDEQCTNTTYDRNTTANLLSTIGRVQAYGLRCATHGHTATTCPAGSWPATTPTKARRRSPTTTPATC